MLRGINMAGMFENYINTVKGRLADPLGTLATALKEGMPTKENPLGMFGFGGLTVHKLKDIGQLGLKVFENPTRDQAIATALKAPDQEVRGFVTKDGKVFVWRSRSWTAWPSPRGVISPHRWKRPGARRRRHRTPRRSSLPRTAVASRRCSSPRPDSGGERTTRWPDGCPFTLPPPTATRTCSMWPRCGRWRTAGRSSAWRPGRCRTERPRSRSCGTETPS